MGFLILFVLGFESGLGPLTWLIMAVGTTMMWVGTLLMAQISTILMESVVKLFPFAVITCFGILFIIRVVPETNGKTVEEIVETLNKWGETSEDRAEVVWE